MKKWFQFNFIASDRARSGCLAKSPCSEHVSFTRLAQLIFIFLFFIANGHAQPAVSVFNEANKSYEQGKYSEAALAYEKMIGTGSVSGPVYFNLGNAYLKSGKLGRAIVAYRNAQTISPRDPDVRANLAFAQNQAGGGKSAPTKLWERFLGKLTLNEWAVLTSIVVSLWFILLALRQWRADRKKSFRGMIASFGLASGLLLVCLAAATYEKYYSSTAVVIVSEAVVRLGPLEESQSAFTLRDGAEVAVVGKKNDWLQITDANQRSGWIPQRQILTVD